jgi:RNA-directed DNA polymerase
VKTVGPPYAGNLNVRWEGKGRVGAYEAASEALQQGKPAATDRLRLPSLSHSFTLDYVCAFEHQEEAERFYAALGPRLEKFGLTLATEKTRVLPFSRHQPPGQGRFAFLGFEFYWGQDRAGKAHLKRRTARAKLRASLQRFTQWCRENRHLRLRMLFKQLNGKLRGYYNYYGVHGNSASLKQFFDGAVRILLKWLNRRSQRRSYNWQGFKDILEHFKVERPRIIAHPKTRKATVMA